MKNILAKVTTAAATTTALSVAIAVGANQPAIAITFNFSWKGDAGYSALGSFSYDENTAPSIISESGIGVTQYLESLSVSFFDPSNNLLETGTSISKGISNNSFLAFNFDTVTQKFVGAIDVDTGGDTAFFFLANDSNGVDVVPPGTTLTLWQVQNEGIVALDSSTNPIKVSQVPEPGSIFGLVAFGALGATLKGMKKRVSSLKAEA